MKTVDVETYDSKIFQAIMTIVVKNQNDLYAITLKDLCKELQVDINAVNRFLELNYSALRADNLPHLELPVFNSDDTWHYIIQGGINTMSQKKINISYLRETLMLYLI